MYLSSAPLEVEQAATERRLKNLFLPAAELNAYADERAFKKFRMEPEAAIVPARNFYLSAPPIEVQLDAAKVQLNNMYLNETHILELYARQDKKRKLEAALLLAAVLPNPPPVLLALTPPPTPAPTPALTPPAPPPTPPRSAPTSPTPDPTQPAAGVSTTQPASGVSTAEPASGVSTIQTASGVSTAQPASGVSTIQTASGVSTTQPALEAVDEAAKKAADASDKAAAAANTAAYDEYDNDSLLAAIEAELGNNENVKAADAAAAKKAADEAAAEKVADEKVALKAAEEAAAKKAADAADAAAAKKAADEVEKVRKAEIDIVNLTKTWNDLQTYDGAMKLSLRELTIGPLDSNQKHIELLIAGYKEKTEFYNTALQTLTRDLIELENYNLDELLLPKSKEDAAVSTAINRVTEILKDKQQWEDKTAYYTKELSNILTNPKTTNLLVDPASAAAANVAAAAAAPVTHTGPPKSVSRPLPASTVNLQSGTAPPKTNQPNALKKQGTTPTQANNATPTVLSTASVPKGAAGSSNNIQANKRTPTVASTPSVAAAAAAPVTHTAPNAFPKSVPTPQPASTVNSQSGTALSKTKQPNALTKQGTTPTQANNATPTVLSTASVPKGAAGSSNNIQAKSVYQTMSPAAAPVTHTAPNAPRNEIPTPKAQRTTPPPANKTPPGTVQQDVHQLKAADKSSTSVHVDPKIYTDFSDVD